MSERDVSGLLLFIRGFLDVAALWRGVIDRLALPGWESVPVTLRGTGRAKPNRRGPRPCGQRGSTETSGPFTNMFSDTHLNTPMRCLGRGGW